MPKTALASRNWIPSFTAVCASFPTTEPLSRQLTIIFGLATLRKTLKSIVAEHDDVVESLRKGNNAEFDRLMEIHILEYTRAVDYEDLVEQLRTIEANR